MQTYQDILFNERLLKEFSLFPLNYDLSEVKNYIKIAETIWVEPVVSSEWYEELLEQVSTNTLTDENATALTEAIWPYEGFAVSYESLASQWLHVSETGITKASSDNSESATQKELAYFGDSIRRQLEARKDYCIKWLCSHRESFPLFDPKICDCGCNTNSCCGGNVKGKLNKPNPYQQLYRPIPKCTDIK